MPKKSIFVWVLVSFLFLLPACSPGAGAAPEEVCFSRRCFRVETAQTPAERSRGLQGRTSLGKAQGMLFMFPSSGRHGFWMKDTLIPLDMIWIDAQRQVVAVIADVLPCAADSCPVYTPAQAGLYVLEVNAGTTAEYGIQLGDRAEFR